jgi:hypothetical protein
LAFLEHAPEKSSGHLRRIADFAAAFSRAAEMALGRGTIHVDQFVHWILHKRLSCEDTVQVSRKRLEYHFNMVGAELLNRAWHTA